MTNFQIGDWVVLLILTHKGEVIRRPFPVTGIEPYYDQGQMVYHYYTIGDKAFLGKQCERLLPFNNFEPIPLSEEFIKKNFQPRYKDIYELTTLWGIRPFHDHWQVCLLTMDEFGGGSWEGAFEVHYVHEVQQFLRLLKVGKEVQV